MFAKVEAVSVSLPAEATRYVEGDVGPEDRCTTQLGQSALGHRTALRERLASWLAKALCELSVVCVCVCGVAMVFLNRSSDRIGT